MWSQTAPEVRSSAHNDVYEAGTDDRPSLESISLNKNFREQARSSKFDEIENNNSLLPNENRVVAERATFISTQKMTWKRTGPLDDGDAETRRSTTVGEKSEEHTYFGSTAAGVTVHPDAPLKSREEADSRQEGQIPAAGYGSVSSSGQSGSCLAVRYSPDAPETQGHQTRNDKTKSPRPSLLTIDCNEQLSSILPLSLSRSKQLVGATSSPTSPGSTQWMVIDSPLTGVVLDSSDSHSRSLRRPVETTHFVVVAIDFGTTMSGYAFSFVHDPSSGVHMMRKWEGGDPGVVNQKTPTTLLLNPEGEFHSFGFTARDFYHDLDNKEAKRWLYFEKFKMALHYNTKLNKETPITASNGKSYPALKVFSHALRYFKDHALQELSDQSSTQIFSDDIRWVITVPAIWKAPAKQFMRQAAYEAGIVSSDHPDQLLIALEPEAASIYVRRLKVHQLLLSSDSSTPVSGGGESVHLSPSKFDDVSPFSPDLSPAAKDSPQFNDQISPESRLEVLQTNLRLFDSLPRQKTVGLEMSDDEGTRYMVVDCGGGTVDITVHEMEAKHGYLHELYQATGGPFGSVGVDLAFESLLNEIFGKDFIDSFMTKRPAGWVDLMIAFESRKRAASPYKDNPLNISLPFSFIDYYKKTKGHQVESVISKYNDQGIRWSSQGMLRLTPAAMKRLFHATIERIKQAIGNVLNAVKDIKYLFLVGGFAESPILQHEIRHEFSHILRILIPQDVALTILKGAVCFGLDPTVIAVRRSRLTYGVEVLNRFNPNEHPKSKMVRKDGIDWCTEVFDSFVTVDQPMALGETIVRRYAPAKVGQRSCNISIFSSEKRDVKFITDAGVIKCGTLTLYLTDVASPSSSADAVAHAPKIREIQAVMTFGDTEIKVDAVDVTTGTSVGASIDFLNK